MMRHPALPSRRTWETFTQHRCHCGSSTIELDYCVWAVSTSQLKENQREGRAALRHRQRKGGTRRVGIFKHSSLWSLSGGLMSFLASGVLLFEQNSAKQWKERGENSTEGDREEEA